MIEALKQTSKVGEAGKIEINAPELPEGTEVEAIVLVKSSEADETDYLLSNPENRTQLLEAVKRLENREDLVVISPQEWHEKYSL